MPSVYSELNIAQIPVHKFNETSVFELLNYFLKDCASLLQTAESDFQNLTKEFEILEALINQDEKKSAAELLISVKNLAAGTKDEATQLSRYSRATLFFKDGKIMQAHNLLQQLKTDYNSVLSTSNYTIQETIELLVEIRAFKSTLYKINYYFNPDLEKLYQLFFETELSTKITTACAEFSIKDLKEQTEASQKLTEHLYELLLHIEQCCFKAILFCIDFEGRSRGFIPKSAFPNTAALLSFYEKDKELTTLIQVYAFLNPSPFLLNSFNNLFYDIIAHTKQILEFDAIETTQVTRLRYLKQGLDRACYFNPGFCLGGIREWANETQPTNLTDKSIKNINTYQDLHDFSLTTQTAQFQRSQDGFADLNNNDSHFVFKDGDSIKASSNNEVGFITMINEIIDRTNILGKTYLTRYGCTPVIKLSFQGDNNSIGWHAVGFKILQNTDGTLLFLFRDLNYGEFAINGLDTLKNWFLKFIFKTPYHTWYNRCQISILLPKHKLQSTVITNYYNKIKLSSNPLLIEAYNKYTDDLKRTIILQNLSKKLDSPDNITALLEQSYQAHQEIHNKTTKDNLFCAIVLIHIIQQHEDTNPEIALKYSNQLLHLLNNPTDKPDDVTKKIYKLLSSRGKTYQIVILKALNKSLNDENIALLEEVISELLLICKEEDDEHNLTILEVLLKEITELKNTKDYMKIYKKFLDFVTETDIISDKMQFCLQHLFGTDKKPAATMVAHQRLSVS